MVLPSYGHPHLEVTSGHGKQTAVYVAPGLSTSRNRTVTCPGPLWPPDASLLSKNGGPVRCCPARIRDSGCAARAFGQGCFGALWSLPSPGLPVLARQGNPSRRGTFFCFLLTRPAQPGFRNVPEQVGYHQAYPWPGDHTSPHQRGILRCGRQSVRHLRQRTGFHCLGMDRPKTGTGYPCFSWFCTRQHRRYCPTMLSNTVFDTPSCHRVHLGINRAKTSLSTGMHPCAPGGTVTAAALHIEDSPGILSPSHMLSEGRHAGCTTATCPVRPPQCALLRQQASQRQHACRTTCVILTSDVLPPAQIPLQFCAERVSRRSSAHCHNAVPDSQITTKISVPGFLP